MASFGYRFGVLQSVRLFTILVKYLLFLGFLFILYQIKLKVPSYSLTTVPIRNFKRSLHMETQCSVLNRLTAMRYRSMLPLDNEVGTHILYLDHLPKYDFSYALKLGSKNKHLLKKKNVISVVWYGNFLRYVFAILEDGINRKKKNPLNYRKVHLYLELLASSLKKWFGR